MSSQKGSEQENLDSLKTLELDRQKLEAKFAKARRLFWKKNNLAWDALDEKLMEIEKLQKNEVGVHDDNEEKWDSERAKYVHDASDGRLKYDSRCDAAFDVFDAVFHKSFDWIGKKFDAFLVDEDELIQKISDAGYVEVEQKLRKVVKQVGK